MSTIPSFPVSLQTMGQIPIGPKAPTVKSNLGRSEILTKELHNFGNLYEQKYKEYIWE